MAQGAREAWELASENNSELSESTDVRQAVEPQANDDAVKTAPEEPGVSSGWAKWLLALAGVFLACGSTVFELAIDGLVSRRGGAVMLAALTATKASLGWSASLFNFIFTGSVSLIGAAVGEGSDYKAGRYARLSVATSLLIGLLCTILLEACADQVLGLFGQEEVTRLAKGAFMLQASNFTITLLGLSLTGVMLGFMYVHWVVVFGFLGGVIGLVVAYSLYLLTDLGLKAFAISTTLGAASSAALSLAFLLRGHRRRKFGLGLGLAGIGLAELRGLGESLGCLAFRSIVSETPYMLSVMWSIRLSPVHGAVFQFLITQSHLADRVAMGFAMGMNFIGSRLWGGKYYGAFWNLLVAFLLGLCTPLALILGGIELARGQNSLARTFAKKGEQVYFDAVMTDSAFACYILIIVARSFYKMLEQAMIAMQEYWRLAVVQGVSFAAYLCAAVTGYMHRDFNTLLLGSVIFLFCRVFGCAFVLLLRVRAHPMERYKRKSTSDPEHALKLTIDDPAVAKVFGGRIAAKLKEHPQDEFASV